LIDTRTQGTILMCSSWCALEGVQGVSLTGYV